MRGIYLLGIKIHRENPFVIFLSDFPKFLRHIDIGGGFVSEGFYPIGNGKFQLFQIPAVFVPSRSILLVQTAAYGSRSSVSGGDGVVPPHDVTASGSATLRPHRCVLVHFGVLHGIGTRFASKKGDKAHERKSRNPKTPSLLVPGSLYSLSYKSAAYRSRGALFV